MKIFKLGLIVVCLAVCAYPKTEVVKVIKPDTTIKRDTIISYDTLVITKTYRDTSIYLKSDTAIIKQTNGTKPPKKR